MVMQRIHERSRGWVAWVIIGGIAFVLMLFGVENYFGIGPNSTVAKVNGEEINQQQFARTYEQLRSQLQIQSITSELEEFLKKEALQTLIQAKVLATGASQAGYQVSVEHINELLAQVPELQIDGEFSPIRFQDYLRSNGYHSANEFTNDIQQRLLAEQVRIGFIASEFVLDQEVEAAAKLLFEKRDIAYLTVPVEELKQAQVVNDEMLEQFYTENTANYEVPEELSLDYLELSLDDLRDKVDISADEIQQYYYENIANYTKPAQWKLAHILVSVADNADKVTIDLARKEIAEYAEQLAQGEDFAELASRVSHDVISGMNGGALGWVNARSQRGSELQAGLANLAVGEVSQPLRTEYGFELVKLIEQKPEEITPFSDDVSEQIETLLITQLAQEQFMILREELADVTYERPNTLDYASTILHLPIKSTEFFTRTSNHQGILTNPNVVATAFSSEVLGQKYNSQVLEISPEQVVVVRVKEHKPLTVQPLEEVKEIVKEDLVSSLAEQAVQEQGEQLLKQLEQMEATDTLPILDDYQWQKVEAVTRTTSDLDEMIRLVAFEMQRGSSLVYRGVLLSSGDYVIVTVNSVTEGQATEEERESLSEGLAQQLGFIAYELYARELTEKADVIEILQ